MKLRKLICLGLVSCMMLGLTACGNSSTELTEDQIIDLGESTGDPEDGIDSAARGDEESNSSDSESKDNREKDNGAKEEGTKGDATKEVKESSLKGTGPAKKEDAFAGGTETEAQLKAGDVLVDINFDDGDVDGFVTYTNGGDFALSNEDGKLVSTIRNCGSLDYANQIYWDGFSLSEKCVYTYSFDISSDIERKVEYRLQLNGGDYHAYQGEKIDVGPEVTNFSVDFEMKEESDPAPRIVFNMGKMEDMDSDPGEHKVYIDNIKLTVKDATNAIEVSALPTYVNVAVDQIGYKTNDKKIASVKTDSTGEEEFIVCDANTNETVYTGLLGEPVHDYGSDREVRQADFSELTESGEYYVVTNEGASYTFWINDNPYTEVYRDAVLMLYKQRCGNEIKDIGAFSHGACHTENAVVYGNESVSVDVSGGWHDAGDYGRYTVSTAKTIADLLLSYEDFGIEDDQMGIPESGNGIPDLLDEARIGLDWMLKMQDPETGGVYHKVTCATFPETVAPEEETDQLILSPISITATGDFAACLAKASVIYKDIDPEFSANALDAAKKAWEYMGSLDKFLGFKNPSDIVTGEYPDDKTLDERYWAAVELYLAGVEDGTVGFIDEVGTDDIKEGLGWADMGLYANYDLTKSDDATFAAKGKDQIIASADELIAQAPKTGYNLGFGSGFPWGSNMMVANHGELLYMASKLTGEEKYSEMAKHQLHYLFGTNALGYCFVTGYGTLSPENPHHRPSQVAGQAVSGMLVGGPNKNLDDPYAIAVLKEESPATSYVDNVQSYSTNEVAIYWNSPLIYLLSAEN